jgi:hypothetical protein
MPNTERDQPAANSVFADRLKQALGGQ